MPGLGAEVHNALGRPDGGSGLAYGQCLLQLCCQFPADAVPAGAGALEAVGQAGPSWRHGFSWAAPAQFRRHDRAMQDLVNQCRRVRPARVPSSTVQLGLMQRRLHPATTGIVRAQGEEKLQLECQPRLKVSSSLGLLPSQTGFAGVRLSQLCRLVINRSARNRPQIGWARQCSGTAF